MKNLFIITVAAFLLFAPFTGTLSTASAQGWQWCHSSSGAGMEAFSIATDGAGNVYGGGSIFDAGYATFGSVAVPGVPFTKQSVWVKYDASGKVLWADGTHDGDTYLNGIATDRAGNLILFGYFNGGSMQIGAFTLTNTYPGGEPQFFLAKVSPTGTVLWAINDGSVINYVLIGFAGAVNLAKLGAVTTDSIGNIYITSSFNQKSITIGSTTLNNSDPSGSTYDIFVAKYTAAGVPVWASSIGGNKNDYSIAIALSAGNVYVAGGFTSSSMTVGSTVISSPYVPNAQAYIAKFSSTGTPTWAENAGGKTGAVATGLTSDQYGNVYMTGGFTELSISFGATTLSRTYPFSGVSALFLVRYSPADVVTWGKTIASPTKGTWGVSVAYAPCGQIWVGGNYSEKAIADPGDTISFVPGSDPTFIAGYDLAGKVIGYAGLPTGGDDGFGIACDALGDVFVSGDYECGSPIYIGPDTLVSPGGHVEEFFMTKYKNFPGVADTTYINHDTTICDLGEGGLTLTAPAGYTLYSWDDGSTGAGRKVTASGKYYVNSISCGSLVVDSFTVTIKGLIKPFISLSATASYPVGSLVTVTAVVSGSCSTYTIHWMNKGVEFTTTTAPFVTYTKGDGIDSITALIVPECGVCDNSATSSLQTVLVSTGVTRLPGVPTDVHIFPNPAKTSITISARGNIKHVAIIDMVGQEVLTHEYDAEKVHVDVAGLPGGVYFVKINGSEAARFVKE
jgi:hypothetical protein